MANELSEIALDNNHNGVIIRFLYNKEMNVVKTLEKH